MEIMTIERVLIGGAATVQSVQNWWGHEIAPITTDRESGRNKKRRAFSRPVAQFFRHHWGPGGLTWDQVFGRFDGRNHQRRLRVNRQIRKRLERWGSLK